ncbi:MAG: HAD-IIIA family hydrolase [Deinococcus sp.]|nr:HAD-IIIA family hydrolase [Deinococcus sp.]
MARALFLDFDGTVRTTISGKLPPKRPERIVILSDVPPVLALWREAGYLLIGVTNQGGVAFGFHGEAEARATTQATVRLLNLHAAYYCPYHPEGTVRAYAIHHPNRKPAPGMAFTAALDWGLDLLRSAMVGDSAEDEAFAQAAGIGRYYYRDQFFGQPVRPEDLEP